MTVTASRPITNNRPLSVLLAFFSLFVLVFSSQANEVNEVIKQVDEILPAGVYNGEANSGGMMQTVVTRFELDENDELVGSYAITDNGRLFTGKLYDCEMLPSNVLACKWQDEFGVGPVQMLFNQNASAFAGFWGGRDELLKFHWYGSRVGG